MRFFKIFFVVAFSLMLAAASHAAPFTQAFRNDFETDSIYLFITEGDTNFTGWIRLPNEWDVGLHEADTLSAFGPEIDQGNAFIVRFDNRGSFTLEWAEVLNGVIQGSGSLFAENGRFVGSSNDFNSTIPTPIPQGLWLLGSGLICLIALRRRIKI